MYTKSSSTLLHESETWKIHFLEKDIFLNFTENKMGLFKKGSHSFFDIEYQEI